MKIIPGITFLVWGGFLSGYWLFPGLFKEDAVQFFLTVLFSVFLPVSFWQLAKQGKGKYFSLLFIGIFIVNISLLAMIIRGNFTMQEQVAAKVNQGIEQELAEYMVTGATIKQRRVAARLIYQQHGVALPFRNETGSYSLYVPSKADKKKFQEHFFADNKLKLTRSEFAASLFTAVALLIIHVGLFIGLLVFLVLYDRGEKQQDTLE